MPLTDLRHKRALDRRAERGLGAPPGWCGDSFLAGVIVHIVDVVRIVDVVHIVFDDQHHHAAGQHHDNVVGHHVAFDLAGGVSPNLV